MTIRAIIIALLFSFVGAGWMHQASLVQAPGMAHAPIYLLSVPPVPAVFLLLALLIAGPLVLRAFGQEPLSRRELLFIFIVLVITIPPVTYGITELMIPFSTAASYFADPANHMAALSDAMPGWFHPHSDEIIRQMYEGSEDERVPWGPWLYPLAMHTLFMALVFTTTLCMVTLFRHQWAEAERLRYPLLLVPLSIVDRKTPGSAVHFFRNPLVYLGIGIVFTHHLLSIAAAHNPAIHALGNRTPIGRSLFTEAPWTAYSGLTMFHIPQVIGMGWFVPLDVLFTGWFTHLMQSTLRFGADVLGLAADPVFPYIQEQGAGAFPAMALMVFWIGRRRLLRIAQKALGLRADIDDSEAPMSHRVAFLGAAGGFVALVVWTSSMGAPPAHALLFFFLFISSSFAFARLRSETGIPTNYGPTPLFLTHVFQVLGTGKMTAAGNLRGLAVLHTFDWMGKGMLGSMSAYQAENHQLADEAGIYPRRSSPAMLVAFIVGCAIAYYWVLGSYYQYGANVLHGGGAMGGINIRSAVNQWTAASTTVDHAVGPNLYRVGGIVGGAAATMAMVFARWRWLRSPFHPLGYIACARYGYALWWPFLVTWVLKSIAHYLGGARLYRRLMPFFLGLAFGDLLAGGLSWIAMAIFGHDITGGYMVQFG